MDWWATLRKHNGIVKKHSPPLLCMVLVTFVHWELPNMSTRSRCSPFFFSFLKENVFVIIKSLYHHWMFGTWVANKLSVYFIGFWILIWEATLIPDDHRSWDTGFWSWCCNLMRLLISCVTDRHIFHVGSMWIIMTRVKYDICIALMAICFWASLHHCFL